MAISEVAREQTSSTLVEKGLYVLRYIDSGVQDPPLVYVRASFGSESNVRLIAAPDANPAVLASPGTAMVVLAEQRAGIQMTVQANGRSGSLEATLRFEPLHEVAGAQGFDAAPSAPTKQEPRATPSTAGFQLMAHVSRRGDVSAAADRWIAGPDAPAPIEAVAATLPSGSRVGLQYQVMVRGSAHWSDWVDAGGFAGTRGQFLALTGIRFRLSGHQVADYKLQGSALFLGASILEQSGEAIEFRSASGQDPLVGLKLEIKTVPPRTAMSDRVIDRGRNEWSPSPIGERKSRVRVFRAGVEQG